MQTNSLCRTYSSAGDVRIEVQRGERRFFVTASLNP